MTSPKKLIEVSLPLTAINQAAAHEKMPGIGPHPRGLHHWWSRKPLAAARAMLWASLVDDPASHPELFPDEQSRQKERQRLHELLIRLVAWQNCNNPQLLAEARSEIAKSMGNANLAFLDPFAGGGAIPLEAQRLGLKAIAHDLNPVAVMINKAMLEIPPRFAGQPPCNPASRKTLQPESSHGNAGLASDIRHYGKLVRDLAFAKIGNLYPRATLPDGSKATILAWLWARAVTCPNPICACEMPLASSFCVARKKGKNIYVEPIVNFAANKISYRVKEGGAAPKQPKLARGANFQCVKCGAVTTPAYVKEQGKAGRIGSHLLAMVAEGKRGKIYLAPDTEQINAANISNPENLPYGELTGKAKNDVWAFGIRRFSDLFTPRQLTALTTLGSLIEEIQAQIERDALQSGFSDSPTPLAEGGSGAKAYAQAVAVYLAFALDRCADFNNSFASWSASNEKVMHLFNKQAIPMVWDYAEANILADGVGSFTGAVNFIADCLGKLPEGNVKAGQAGQSSAQENINLANLVISTDPPYYSNIGYADIADFFYVWLRNTLKKIYPGLFGTMLTPKSEELVATPFRFAGDKARASEFFEKGMFEAFANLARIAREDVPVTIYYAFKQNESKDGGHASSGWETMLQALIQAGFSITGTWPLRTEQKWRSNGMNANALASSIVLVCRKRPADARPQMRRRFLDELQSALPDAMIALQQAGIAPVDLAQAAIGPGMAVFSKYSSVLAPDGTALSVGDALQAINEALDIFLGQQHGDMDAATRFCLDLYGQNGFNDIKFGDADVLARARNISVEKLADMGVVFAQKGQVHLLDRRELPERPKAQALQKCMWLMLQYLVKAQESGGNQAAARLAAQYPGEADNARHLAWQLYALAERKGWASEALAWNGLAASWPDIQREMVRHARIQREQGTL